MSNFHRNAHRSAEKTQIKVNPVEIQRDDQEQIRVHDDPRFAKARSIRRAQNNQARTYTNNSGEGQHREQLMARRIERLKSNVKK